MSENERASNASAGAAMASSTTAGQLLRAARERSGMPLSALASAIKVPPQKLEALESDRLADLPDATFARALAKTVCRFLKVDPEPVLARLPDVKMSELEHVAQGLNQPFRDGSHRPGFLKAEFLRRPAVLASLLLVLAALLLWALPPGVWQSWSGEEQAAPDGEPPPSTASEMVPLEPLPIDPSASAPPAAVPPAPVVPAVPAVPPLQAVPPAAVPAVPPASASGAEPGAALAAAEAVVLRTSAPSWIELRDAQGKILVSRQLAGGETAALAGRFPMRLSVGNVSGTEVTVRGQPFDLRAHARNNVARLELQ